MAEDKLYQAEYVGSGTFKISKPKRKKIKCGSRKSGTRAAARASKPARAAPSRSAPSPFNSRAMKITELVLHPIAIADPPLRSSYGLHAPFALRTDRGIEDGLRPHRHSAKPTAAMGRWPGWKRCAPRVTGMDPFQLAGLWRDLSREAEHAMASAPGGRIADLSGAGRESARPPRAHFRGHRDRLPRPDRQGHRQAGLRRDRRTRARRSQLLRLPVLQARRRRRHGRRRARGRVRRGAVGRGVRARVQADDRAVRLPRDQAEGRRARSGRSRSKASARCAASSARSIPCASIPIARGAWTPRSRWAAR